MLGQFDLAVGSMRFCSVRLVSITVSALGRKLLYSVLTLIPGICVLYINPVVIYCTVSHSSAILTLDADSDLPGMLLVCQTSCMGGGTVHV